MLNIIYETSASKNFNSFLKESSSFLYKNNLISDKKIFINKIIERENLGSTLITLDTKLPHINSDCVLINSIIVYNLLYNFDNLKTIIILITNNQITYKEKKEIAQFLEKFI